MGGGVLGVVRLPTSRFVVSSVLELVLLYVSLLVLGFAVLVHLISSWLALAHLLGWWGFPSVGLGAGSLVAVRVFAALFVLYSFGLIIIPISLLLSIQSKNNVPAVVGVLISWGVFISFIILSSLFIPRSGVGNALMYFFDSFMIFYFIVVVASSLVLVHVHMLVRELPLKPAGGRRKNTVIRFAGSVSNFIRFKYGKTTSPLFFFLIFHMLNVIMLLSATAYSRYVIIGELYNNAISSLTNNAQTGGVDEQLTPYPGLVSSFLRFFVAIIGSQQSGATPSNGLPISPGLFALMSTAIIGSIGIIAYLIIPYYEIVKDVRSAVHKYMISTVSSIVSSTKDHLVIAGYGAMGKAIVRGVFQHELSEEKRWMREEMLWYLNEEDAVLDFKSVVTNMVIIDREHEEWDYKIDDPVLNAVGIEEVMTTPGDSVLVPITGPTIVSDLMMRKINAYDAKVLVTTFRDPRVDTYMSQKLFDMEYLRSPTIILRSLTAPLYSTITMHDIIGQLHRYYPEYVFGTVILRRLWVEMISLLERRLREKGNKKKKIRFIPVIIGHGKPIYYILKSFLLMYDEYSILTLIEKGGQGMEVRVTRIGEDNKPNDFVIPITKPIKTKGRGSVVGVDAIVISDESELVSKYVVGVDDHNGKEFAELKGRLTSLKLVTDDEYLRKKLRLYYATIRHTIKEDKKGKNTSPYGSLVTPLIVSSTHDHVTLSRVIDLFTRKQDHEDIVTIPIFVVVTNIEGLAMEIALELFKVLERVSSSGTYPEDYAVIVAWIYSNEWLRIKEYAYLHNTRGKDGAGRLTSKLKLVNMYNLAKESVCTYTNLVMGGPHEEE